MGNGRKSTDINDTLEIDGGAGEVCFDGSGMIPMPIASGPQWALTPKTCAFAYTEHCTAV